MYTFSEKTLLAFCLALRNPEVTLNTSEKMDLVEVGKSLERHPDIWKAIEADLMQVVAGNSTLNQAYQTAKQQLETISDELLFELLPNLDELERELTTDFNTEKRGRKPGKSGNNDNTDIISEIAVPILQNTDNASKISFLERLQQNISGSSSQDSSKNTKS